MSAQGRDNKKPNQASQCDKCGNRHEGACLPQCGTCGKVHKGKCRYARPVPTIESLDAARESSQAQLTAQYNAQQFGQQVGYQQAYKEMQSSAMGPGMVPGMSGRGFGPVGGFGGPYVGQYPGFGGFGNPGFGNPGWGTQISGQFGAPYRGFPTPNMGQGNVVPGDNASRPTSNYAGKKQSAAEWKEAQKKIGGPKDSRKPQDKEQSKGKKEQKDPLAPQKAGIEKSAPKKLGWWAKKRAAEQAKKDEAKKEEDNFAQDTLSGPTDPELLAFMGESEAVVRNTTMASSNDEAMEDINRETEDPMEVPVRFKVRDLIEDVNHNPAGSEFPQDQQRVNRMAELLAHYGQEQIVDLSNTASMNHTSIIQEAFQQNFFLEQIAAEAAGQALPDPSKDEEL